MGVKVIYKSNTVLESPGAGVGILPVKDLKMGSDLEIHFDEPLTYVGNSADIEIFDLDSLYVTIDGTDYKTLPGMTWYEWANNSEYDDDKFECSGNDTSVLIRSTLQYVEDSSGNPVFGNNEIEIGGTYILHIASEAVLFDRETQLVDSNGTIILLEG